MTSRLGKKNKNEGKFIELARNKAFQKKKKNRKKYFTYVICIKKRTTVEGQYYSKTGVVALKNALVRKF